jgi:hypothetical protein
LLELVTEPTEEEDAAYRALLLAGDPRLFEKMEKFRASQDHDAQRRELEAFIARFNSDHVSEAKFDSDHVSERVKRLENIFAPTPLKPRVI